MLKRLRGQAHTNLADLRLCVLAFIGADLAVLMQSSLIAWPILLAIALCCIGLSNASQNSAWQSLIICGLAGSLLASYSAHIRLEQRFNLPPQGSIKTLNGHVIGLAQIDGFRTRFIFKTKDGRRVRLSWYGSRPDISPGQCFHLTSKLFSGHGSANPGTFDYEGWLWRKNIAATGYVKSFDRCASQAVTVNRLRQLIVERLESVLAEHPMRGIIQAVSVGVTDQISPSQWQVFRRTGTSHLVAISGLHIGLVAAWLWFVGVWLAAHVRMPKALMRFLPAGLSLLGGFLYALLAGLGLPTLRALIMLSLGFFALWQLRVISFSRILALAAAFVVLINPMAVLEPGFWLSFGAVAWIVFLTRTYTGPKWGLFLRLQLGISLGLVPITLLFFGQASLVSPLVNALLIPLASICIPIVLGAVLLLFIWPLLGQWLLTLSADILQKLWVVLQKVSALHWASLELPAPDIWALGLSLLGIGLIFMPRTWPARWLGGIVLLPLLIGWQPRPSVIQPGDYVMSLIDVGQGLAVMVRTQNHILIYDAGPKYRSGFNAGRDIVEPFLINKNITVIDRLMISHADNDHMGGAQALLEDFNVRSYWGAGAPVPCWAGQIWRWDGVDFQVLWPRKNLGIELSSNDGSCVLVIKGAGGVSLLTGDIEARSERLVLDQKAPEVDVLVVPHHGSKSSSTTAFVKATHPKWALVSSGYGSRFGHPAAAVVRRYKNVGAEVFDTARAGEIRVQVFAEGIEVRRWRKQQHRLWSQP